MIKHVGIRPIHQLAYSIKGVKPVDGLKYEEFPDGSHRVWHKRMLESGCDHEFETVVDLDDLIYCPNCVEYFSKDQFEKVEG